MRVFPVPDAPYSKIDLQMGFLFLVDFSKAKSIRLLISLISLSKPPIEVTVFKGFAFSE